MDDSDRKITFTNRDLMKDFDESKLDRVGPPVRFEEHKVDKPETAETSVAKSSHTLTDMAQEFEFFTTAVIHATTVFDRDPIEEFNHRYPAASQDDLPMAIDYAHPFFTGLKVCLVAGVPVNFDNRIYAIRRHRWEQLRNLITGIAMMHRESGFYAKLAFYELEIVDPFAVRKMAVVNNPPMVSVTVFAVSSNKAFSYIAPSPYPLRPRLVSEKPRQDTVIEANAVLGPPPSPEKLLPKKEAQ